MHQKSDVIRLFLQFIQQYVPLSEAIITSLGGEGKEAGIWQEAGIAPANGWVIERNKDRSRSLIRKLPYRYTASLATFAEVYTTHKGSKAGLDAFHLDVCGTLEPLVSQVQRIMPLVVRSRGRCLAITVADARRNLSIEQFSEIETRLRLRLRFRYSRILTRLNLEQGEGRELAVMREIGFFYHMLQVLKHRNGYYLPVRMKRISYVSRKTGSGFPMRTYFFHFGKSSVRRESELAKALYKLWFGEELVNLNKRPVTEAVAQETEQPMSKAVAVVPYSNLQALVTAAGGPALEQYNELLSKATGKQGFGNFFEDLKNLVNRYAPLVDAAEVSKASKNGGEPTPRPARRKRRGSKRRRKASVQTQIPENGQRLEAQLTLIDACAKSEKAFEKAKQKLAKTWKMSRKSNKNNILGGMYARTQGKHRPDFLRRLAAVHPDRINEHLAAAFSKITETEVTVDQLKSEAGL